MSLIGRLEETEKKVVYGREGRMGIGSTTAQSKVPNSWSRRTTYLQSLVSTLIKHD